MKIIVSRFIKLDENILFYSLTCNLRYVYFHQLVVIRFANKLIDASSYDAKTNKAYI